MSQVKNNRISILEQCDSQGLCKETLIYHDCFTELIDKLKKQMEVIECADGTGFINNVEVNVSKDIFLDGSILYTISYNEIIDNVTGENITHLFHDEYYLIVNIPIIDYR